MFWRQVGRLRCSFRFSQLFYLLLKFIDPFLQPLGGFDGQILTVGKHLPHLTDGRHQLHPQFPNMFAQLRLVLAKLTAVMLKFMPGLLQHLNHFIGDFSGD